VKHAILLALTLPVLAACQTVQPAPVPTPTPILDLLPENVQQAVMRSCGIVVEREFIISLISRFDSRVETAAEFVRAVCAAFVRRSAVRYQGGTIVTTFRGVQVQGQRVR
jgi:hypothetical protein